MNEWVDGRMDRRMDGRMDGQGVMDGCTYIYLYSPYIQTINGGKFRSLQTEHIPKRVWVLLSCQSPLRCV